MTIKNVFCVLGPGSTESSLLVLPREGYSLLFSPSKALVFRLGCPYRPPSPLISMSIILSRVMENMWRCETDQCAGYSDSKKQLCNKYNLCTAPYGQMLLL